MTVISKLKHNSIPFEIKKNIYGCYYDGGSFIENISLSQADLSNGQQKPCNSFIKRIIRHVCLVGGLTTKGCIFESQRDPMDTKNSHEAFIFFFFFMKLQIYSLIGFL